MLIIESLAINLRMSSIPDNIGSDSIFCVLFPNILECCFNPDGARCFLELPNALLYGLQTSTNNSYNRDNKTSFLRTFIHHVYCHLKVNNAHRKLLERLQNQTRFQAHIKGQKLKFNKFNNFNDLRHKLVNIATKRERTFLWKTMAGISVWSIPESIATS